MSTPGFAGYEPRYAVGQRVQWHDDERSYEGRVFGQRTLCNGAVLVHINQQWRDQTIKVAVRAERLSLIG